LGNAVIHSVYYLWEIDESAYLLPLHNALVSTTGYAITISISCIPAQILRY